MEQKTKNTIDVQAITDGLQQLADVSLSALRSSVESGIRNMGEMNRIMQGMGAGMPGRKKHSDCCPPEHECPPHCLLHLTRKAYAGESVKIPFAIKNTCHGPKHYRVGVRPLKDAQGNPAPSQPVLDKTEVDLDSGESIAVMMAIDLTNFSAGQSYSAEIVVREKDINQNICFTLYVEGYSNIPVARPLEEKKYLVHWQGWQSHFYCEPVKKVIDVKT